MTPWRRAFCEGLLSGSLASIASTLALVAFGRSQARKPAAPVNATSHWVFGDPALHEREPDLRHTATGYAIHHAASLMWATFQARAWGARPQAAQLAPTLAASTMTAALACLVDYRLTPHRLRPGFEHHISRGARAAVYGCFALGLAAATVALARRHRAREEEAGRRAREAPGPALKP